MVRKVLFITEFSVHADNEDKISEFDNYTSELGAQLGIYGLLVDVYITNSTDFCPIRVTRGSKGVRFIYLSGKVANSIESSFSDLILDYMLTYRLSYDIIHIDGNKWLEVGKQLKINLKIPLVNTFTSSSFSGLTTSSANDLAQLADHLIVKNISDQDKLQKVFQINPDKISLIPVGFHADDFYPVNKYLAKTILGVEETDKIILHTNSIDDGQGLFNLIAALGILKRNRHYTPRLIILSEQVKTDENAENSQISRLKKLVACWDLGNDVNFIGSQHTVTLKYLYSAADLLINTSSDDQADSLQAIACGTLVIDTVNSQFHGKNPEVSLGYRIHQDRPIVLAGYINQMLNRASMKEQSAEQAFLHAVSAYSWSESGKKLFRIYERLLYISPFLSAYPDRIENYQGVLQKFEQRLS